MDPLVVARKRGRSSEPDVRARRASRRRHRRRGDNADLRRPRRRDPVHSLPVRVLGGDARPRVAGSAAPRSRCRHGDRHGVAIWGTVDRRDQRTANGLAPNVDARTGPDSCGPDPVPTGAPDARTTESGVRGLGNQARRTAACRVRSTAEDEERRAPPDDFRRHRAGDREQGSAGARHRADQVPPAPQACRRRCLRRFRAHHRRHRSGGRRWQAELAGAGTVDRPCAFCRIARQVGRAGRTRRRGLRHRSLLTKCNSGIPGTVRSGVRLASPQRPARLLQRLVRGG